MRPGCSRFLRLGVIGVLVAGTLDVASSAQGTRISGTVTYQEPLALPLSAVVEVTLEDVTRIAASGDIVARTQFTPVGRGTVEFLLYYEAALVDPARRYAVRARLVDGDRVLLDSIQPVPVLTQGRGSEAVLTLRPVSRTAVVASAAPAPAAGVTPAASALVGLRDLPATFTGTLGDVRYQVDLLSDDAYFLRTARPGSTATDRIGSYVVSSDRRAVMLDGGEVFLIRSNTLLRGVDRAGETIGDLRRTAGFTPLSPHVVFEGVYRHVNGVGTFTECTTGQQWVVDGPAAGRLAAAADEVGVLGGAGVLTSVDGTLTARRVEGAVTSSFAVSRVISTTSRGRCAPRFTSAPLANTFWRLIDIRGADVAAGDDRGEPGITFRDDEARSFGGNTGCNKLSGGYRVAGDAFTVHSIGTLRVCAADRDEATFRTALDAARSYRILGRTLELFDADRQILARFEADR